MDGLGLVDEAMNIGNSEMDSEKLFKLELVGKKEEVVDFDEQKFDLKTNVDVGGCKGVVSGNKGPNILSCVKQEDGVYDKPKIDLIAEMNVLDSKAHVKIPSTDEAMNVGKSEIIIEDVFQLKIVEKKEAGVDFDEQRMDLKTDVVIDQCKGISGTSVGDSVTAEGKPKMCCCGKQEDAKIDKPKIDSGAKMVVLDSETYGTISSADEAMNIGKSEIFSEEIYKLEIVEKKEADFGFEEEMLVLNTDVDIDKCKGVEASNMGGATDGDSVTAEGKPRMCCCGKQEDVIIDKPYIDLETKMDVRDSKAFVKIPSENNIDEADVQTGNVGEVAEDNPAEAGGNHAKKRRYKKRKKPPPFIGPQRPIMEEDLEDIMNGVYDIQIDILGTDEDTPVLSSSNESCNSSDSEGWLVDSSDESDAAVADHEHPGSAMLALIKTKIQDAKASKDRLCQTTNFVGTDVNLALLDASVRESVAFADPHLQAGLDALTALSNTPMNVLSLLKHTHFLETALRLCKYMPPQLPHTDRPLRNSSMENALRINNEAVHVLNHIMAFFGAGNIEELWKVIIEKVGDFEEKTKHMKLDEKYLLIEDPPACDFNPSGRKRYAFMMIDDIREEDRFADDESQTENPLKESGNSFKNPRVPQRHQSVVRNKKRRGKENRDSPSKVCKKKRIQPIRGKSTSQGLSGEILPHKRSTGPENAEKQTASKSLCQIETNAKSIENLVLQRNFEVTPRKANDKWPIGSLTSMEVEDCEDLLVDSDDSGPFREKDCIATSLSGTIDGKTIGAASGFQTSLESNSGIFSRTYCLRELPSRQTISRSSEGPISDALLLQSSDSDF